MTEYKVIPYTSSHFQEWEGFIVESVNGTFLQSRHFLEYHPASRFTDVSLMIYDSKNTLVAVCPACSIQTENGCLQFYSHKGSTFGGLIFNRKNYTIQKTLNIYDAFEEYVKQQGYKEIILKLTPDIFCYSNSALLQYLFYYKGYSSIDELSLYVDFDHYKDDVYSNLSQGKRTDVNNCIKAGMKCQKLDTNLLIEDFYNILCQNLVKYDAKPVHTLSELLDFKNNRLKDECDFWGIFLDGKLIAGSMMFYFSKTVVHTQYLCALNDYSKLSPMTFLYYSMLLEMKSKGYKIVSWGSTTEDNGFYLNLGLVKSKEAYGSQYSINKSYRKELDL